MAKISSDQGWSQLVYTMGHKMPRQLHAAARARRALLAITTGKGRG